MSKTDSQNKVYKKHRLITMSLITLFCTLIFVFMLLDGYNQFPASSFSDILLNVVSSNGVSLLYLYGVYTFMAFLFNFFYKKPFDNKGV